MPVLVARLVPTATDAAEQSEELRLMLLQLVDCILDKCAAATGPSLGELVAVLTASLGDAFPDANENNKKKKKKKKKKNEK